MHVRRSTSTFAEGGADAFFLYIHVVGVEVYGDVGFVDHVLQHQRLRGCVKQMCFVAVARFNAEGDAKLASLLCGRFQRLHDIFVFALGRRLAGTIAARTKSNAAQNL